MRAYCQMVHPTWSITQIIEEYWIRDSLGRLCFALKDRPDVQVKFLSDIPRVRYRACGIQLNPYTDQDYLKIRKETAI